MAKIMASESLSRSATSSAILGLALLVTSGTARALPIFPAALQDAIGLECAPECSICHAGTPSKTTWTLKPFGAAMGAVIIPNGDNEAAVAKAYAAYKDASAMDPKKADGVKRLEAGLDPDTGTKLCQITYGCGAHIAKTTPRRDWSGVLFVAGAMLFGALLRRGKARSATA